MLKALGSSRFLDVQIWVKIFARICRQQSWTGPCMQVFVPQPFALLGKQLFQKACQVLKREAAKEAEFREARAKHEEEVG